MALVTHGRHAHGDPWPAVVERAGIFWPPFYPFSVGLKRATGLHTPAFYREAYDSLNTTWRRAAFAKTLTPATRLTPLTRQLPRYSHPQPDPTAVDGDAVLAVRRSQTRIAQLVRLRTGGREEAVAPLGINVDDAFHVGGGRATWSRVRFAERRPNENYSDVFVADLAAGGRTRRLTDGGRYFSPGLSPDGERVVAVRQELLPGSTCLVELDADTGSELRAVCFALDLLAAPRYASSGEIVAVAKRNGYVALHALDFDGGARALTPWTRHVIGTPFVEGGRVVFSASFTGTDNVFSVPLEGGGGILQLTEAAVGAYAPSVAGDLLYYTEVDRLGDPVSVLARADWLGRPLDTIVEPVDLPAYAPYRPTGAALRFRETYTRLPRPGAVTAVTPGSAREASAPRDDGAAYRSLLRGFQVHTVQPLVDNVEASVSLLGENVLSDLQAEATVRYNYNERRYRVTGAATVAKTWPWVRVEVAQAGRGYLALDPDSLAADTIRLVPAVRRFDEQRVGLRLVAPLQQVAGAYSYSLTPDAGVQFLRFSEADAATDRALGGDGLVALDLSVSARRIRQTAPKQVGPREGQIVDLDFRRGLGGDPSQQFRVTLGQYFPGVHRSHSGLLRLSHRAESTQRQYQFTDRFFYARGYTSFLSDASTTVSVDYRFPLLYPDVGVAGIVYCRRLRAGVWGDLTDFRYDPPYGIGKRRVRSAGVDLTADLTLFNAQSLPIGVRFAYRFDDFFLEDNRRGFAEPRLLLALPF